MIVLHGSWVPPTKRRAGTFFVWGETSDPPSPRRRGRPPRVKPHPFQAPPAHLLRALIALAPEHGFHPGSGQVDTIAAQVLLPSLLLRPLASPQLFPDISDEEREAADSVLRLRLWKLEGLALAPATASAVLASFPQWSLSPSKRVRGYVLGADLSFWSTAAKFALELLARQRLLPALVRDGPGKFRAAWTPVLDDPWDGQRLLWLARAMPSACRSLSMEGAGQTKDSRALVEDFLGEVTDVCVRQWAGRPPPRESRGTACRAPTQVASRWVEALQAADPAVQAPLSQLTTLYDQWRAWTESLHVAADSPFRICCRLEPPSAGDGEPVKEKARPRGAQPPPEEGWTLRFFLQASDDPSLLVPAERVWRERGSTLRFLNRRFDQPQEPLLAGLGMASRLFPPLERSLRSARPQACHLTVHQAHTFLREAAPLLEQSGFGVLVPPWWGKRGAGPRLRARLSSGDTSRVVERGILSMDSIVQYDWQLALGGEELSWEEFDELAALKMPLVQVRGQWVELDPARVEAIIRFWDEHHGQQEMHLRDALRLGLGEEGSVEGLPLTGVEAEGWIADLLGQLREGDCLVQLPQPKGFTGQLRPYQALGFSWLAFLRRWGLGACLADDMGLGKTIETIALLLYERERGVGGKPVLIICPTSVVGNWYREMARFSPSLRVLVHHGADRATGKAFAALVRAHDLVLSTYALARRDEQTLRSVEWAGVILDEAQNIKNPFAKQTHAIRRLRAEYRVALTGTPVENRLSELWSIMQFLNPGYLGSQKAFRSHFALPIERYQEERAAKRLQSLVRPFVLRRVKTDPRIIQDLPEKMELKVHCTLTSEQVTLYEAVVRDSLKQIEESEGIRRRGIVLATLLRLKQVCNHPAQFLGDGSALPGRSGKLARLTEMLEEVLAVEDNALVFTQFAVMGEMLKAHLQEAFGREVLFLHGGTLQKQRDRMVRRFQEDRHAPPIFILSLKAGGLGLNLTKANHVFHFDRWWNPAVEDQATDRAFRIGQTRDVLVHKFICIGTLEERIDELIESKKELAEMVIGVGEGWLTELSTDELRDLMTLRRDTVRQ